MYLPFHVLPVRLDLNLTAPMCLNICLSLCVHSPVGTSTKAWLRQELGAALMSLTGYLWRCFLWWLYRYDPTPPVFAGGVDLEHHVCISILFVVQPNQAQSSSSEKPLKTLLFEETASS